MTFNDFINDNPQQPDFIFIQIDSEKMTVLKTGPQAGGQARIVSGFLCIMNPNDSMTTKFEARMESYAKDDVDLKRPLNVTSKQGAISSLFYKALTEANRKLVCKWKCWVDLIRHENGVFFRPAAYCYSLDVPQLRVTQACMLCRPFATRHIVPLKQLYDCDEKYESIVTRFASCSNKVQERILTRINNANEDYCPYIRDCEWDEVNRIMENWGKLEFPELPNTPPYSPRPALDYSKIATPITSPSALEEKLVSAMENLEMEEEKRETPEHSPLFAPVSPITMGDIIDRGIKEMAGSASPTYNPIDKIDVFGTFLTRPEVTIPEPTTVLKLSDFGSFSETGKKKLRRKRRSKKAKKTKVVEPRICCACQDDTLTTHLMELPCTAGHFIHGECLVGVIQGSQEYKCPLCRKDLQTTELPRLEPTTVYENVPEPDLLDAIGSPFRDPDMVDVLTEELRSLDLAPSYPLDISTTAEVRSNFFHTADFFSEVNDLSLCSTFYEQARVLAEMLALLDDNRLAYVFYDHTVQWIEKVLEIARKHGKRFATDPRDPSTELLIVNGACPVNPRNFWNETIGLVSWNVDMLPIVGKEYCVSSDGKYVSENVMDGEVLHNRMQHSSSSIRQTDLNCPFNCIVHGSLFGYFGVFVEAEITLQKHSPVLGAFMLPNLQNVYYRAMYGGKANAMLVEEVKKKMAWRSGTKVNVRSVAASLSSRFPAVDSQTIIASVIIAFCDEGYAIGQLIGLEVAEECQNPQTISFNWKLAVVGALCLLAPLFIRPYFYRSVSTASLDWEVLGQRIVGGVTVLKDLGKAVLNSPDFRIWFALAFLTPLLEESFKRMVPYGTELLIGLEGITRYGTVVGMIEYPFAHVTPFIHSLTSRLSFPRAIALHMAWNTFALMLPPSNVGVPLGLEYLCCVLGAFALTRRPAAGAHRG